MGKKILVAFLFFSFGISAQSIRLQGNAFDSTAKQGLPNVLLMAVKFSDSTLVNFTRTNKDGLLKPIKVPLDTYIVIMSHPNFSDKTYLLLPGKNDSLFTFKNVILPPKSMVLNEVEVIAYKDKSYYKGDTLIFTADSFKTRPNATVEDLLKKLPGVRVDAAGKITIQGKQVDQVLVDGDEFFGGDPTIATRNLNAASVENVQVYDKKNESTEEGKEETVKVVNLKLKEDAKKGYFGKVSGASDAEQFYEGELLFNKFKGNRKLSVFGLLANTPKQGFDWGEIDKYGLSGEQEWNYDEENNTWTSNRDGRTGKPQTGKGGFYYSDKFSKRTKLNTDYTFNQGQIQTKEENNTQFFLTDTVYSNANVNSTQIKNQNHAINMRFTHKLDSLTELVVVPKVKYALGENNSIQTSEFVSQENVLTRNTTIQNKNNSEKTDMNVLITVARDFMKKDRKLIFNYQPIYNTNTSTSLLNTQLRYYLNQENDSSLIQKRTQENNKMEHNASLVYTEPFTKKFKTEISYNFSQNQNSSYRNTFDYSGTAYDIFNPLQSNNFENKRLVNKAGAKLIYEVKKYRISIGTQLRNTQQENLNLSNGSRLSLKVDNILPNASFNYKISQGSNLNIRYSTSSQLPDLLQMQPVIDNSNPNRISIGNPNLKPTFGNQMNLNYYFYKGISDVNMWAGANGGNTNNQISYATTFDDQGKAISQPVNINGNYYGNVYVGGGFPVFKKFMKVYYNLQSSFSNNVSMVNGVKNITQNTSFGPNLNFEKQTELFDINLGVNYEYNKPKTNLSTLSSQPYYSYQLSGNILVKLPKKFSITTDGNYNNNGNRTPGYNLNYFIWNASLNKTFLKTENLVLSFLANDILNQNISNQREINSNQIVDTKTQIIRRYFLLKLLYKFNSQKTKEDENEYD